MPDAPDTRLSRNDEFDATYRRLHPKLSGIALRHARDHHRAEDLLQTAIYKAFVRWSSGTQIDNLDAYLTTCLIRACMDHHRWSKRQRRALERFATSQQWFADAAHEPVFANQERQAVDVAFANLDPECQQILRLRVIDGVPVKEVAELLTIAEGTVKSKCSRCLDQLDRLIDS